MTETGSGLITQHTSNLVKDPAVETETYPLTFALPVATPSYCTAVTTAICYDSGYGCSAAWPDYWIYY